MKEMLFWAKHSNSFCLCVSLNKPNFSLSRGVAAVDPHNQHRSFEFRSGERGGDTEQLGCVIIPQFNDPFPSQPEDLEVLRWPQFESSPHLPMIPGRGPQFLHLLRKGEQASAHKQRVQETFTKHMYGPQHSLYLFFFFYPTFIILWGQHYNLHFIGNSFEAQRHYTTYPWPYIY